jgi:hypothetical protein
VIVSSALGYALVVKPWPQGSEATQLHATIYEDFPASEFVPASRRELAQVVTPLLGREQIINLMLFYVETVLALDPGLVDTSDVLLAPAGFPPTG